MEDVKPILTSRERLHRRGICVIVPTYNNEKTIRDVVERCKEQSADVIVVNDGCTDSTAEILASISEITVVTLQCNSGKGTALKYGFRKALELGFAYAITLDADGQHYPEDIPVLLQANILHPGALLIGERKALDKQERSGGSKFANAFSNFWFTVQTGRRLKDTQTGYRLYPLHKLHGLSLLTSRYEAELELLVFSAWHGVSIVSVPVNVYYPPKEERVSHFRPGLDFTRISILNTLLCFMAVVYGLPLKIFRGMMIFLRTLLALSFYLFACFCLMMPFNLILQILPIRLDKKSEMMHRLLYAITRLVQDIHGVPGTEYKILGNKNNYTKPSLIICNHQSHLDLMVMLSQMTKIVVLTNNWVWNSPFFGSFIHRAEFYPISMGVEELLPKLLSLIDRGYSICVYPEGTRSKDGQIGRFHKGAFYIAETLKLDILPLIEYGIGNVLPKGGKYLRKGHTRLFIKDRIPFDEYTKYGTHQEMASWFRKYYRAEYALICDKLDQDA